jgi:hypothetical protein
VGAPSYLGRLRALRDVGVLRAPENDKLRELWMNGHAQRKRVGPALFDYSLTDLGRGYASRVLKQW